MRKIRSALIWSVELRFWVATCVTFLSTFASRALGVDAPLATFVVIFFSTLGLYNLDGSLDASERGARLWQKPIHWTLTALSVSGCAVAARLLPWPAVIILVCGLAICGTYALPWRSRGRSVKRLPGVKAPFVGFSVASAAVFLPVLSVSDPPSWHASLWLTATLGLCCTQNALVFDIPDMAEDARCRVPTFPRAYGLGPTRGLSRALLIAAVLLLLMAPSSLAPGTEFGLLALCAALLLGSSLVDPKTQKASVALGIDGALILPWAVLTLAA